jgi:hypothetical protein
MTGVHIIALHMIGQKRYVTQLFRNITGKFPAKKLTRRDQGMPKKNPIIEKLKQQNKKEKEERKHITIYAPLEKINKFKEKCDNNGLKYNHVWLELMDEFIKD